MLHGLIGWLSARRGKAAIIFVLYFLLISLGHEYVQDAAFWAYKRYSLARVNRVLFHVGWICVALLVIWCAKRWRPTRRGYFQLGYAALLMFLAYAAWRWLFYTTIEAVHFPEYAILAILLFSITRRFSHAVFYLMLLSTADETLQFINAMHRHWATYLDFNDLTFNLLGGCMGCLLLHLDRGDDFADRRPLPLSRSPIFWTCLGLTLTIGLLYVTGVMQTFYNADGSHAPLYLYNQKMPPYWHMGPMNRPYHNLFPWEALPLFAILMWINSLLSRCTDVQAANKSSATVSIPSP